MTRWLFQRCKCPAIHRGPCPTRNHYQRSLASYVPLDELKAMPSVRIVRALRWFDGVSRFDLFVALEVSLVERASFRSALEWLVETGRITREDRLYRVTDAGRAWLGRVLARAA